MSTVEISSISREGLDRGLYNSKFALNTIVEKEMKSETKDKIRSKANNISAKPKIENKTKLSILDSYLLLFGNKQDSPSDYYYLPKNLDSSTSNNINTYYNWLFGCALYNLIFGFPPKFDSNEESEDKISLRIPIIDNYYPEHIELISTCLNDTISFIKIPENFKNLFAVRESSISTCDTSSSFNIKETNEEFKSTGKEIPRIVLDDKLIFASEYSDLDDSNSYIIDLDMKNTESIIDDIEETIKAFYL